MNVVYKKTRKIFTFYVQVIFFVASCIFIFQFYAAVLGFWDGYGNNDYISWTDARASETEFNKTCSWSYDSREWSFHVEIPPDIYAYYKQQDGRSPYTNSQMMSFITSDDPVVIEIANTLDKLADKAGYGYCDKVNFVLSFVQSLEYTSDNVTTSSYEYWRFPVETLVDGGGDCEDRSVLFASVIEAMGHDAVLIGLPGHIAVGVAGFGLSGFYYSCGDVKYYYCETTGRGWAVGELPPQYEGQTPSIIQMGGW